MRKSFILSVFVVGGAWGWITFARPSESTGAAAGLIEIGWRERIGTRSLGGGGTVPALIAGTKCGFLAQPLPSPDLDARFNLLIASPATPSPSITSPLDDLGSYTPAEEPAAPGEAMVLGAPRLDASGPPLECFAAFPAVAMARLASGAVGVGAEMPTAKDLLSVLLTGRDEAVKCLDACKAAVLPPVVREAVRSSESGSQHQLAVLRTILASKAGRECLWMLIAAERPLRDALAPIRIGKVAIGTPYDAELRRRLAAAHVADSPGSSEPSAEAMKAYLLSPTDGVPTDPALLRCTSDRSQNWVALWDQLDLIPVGSVETTPEGKNSQSDWFVRLLVRLGIAHAESDDALLRKAAELFKANPKRLAADLLSESLARNNPRMLSGTIPTLESPSFRRKLAEKLAASLTDQPSQRERWLDYARSIR